MGHFVIWARNCDMLSTTLIYVHRYNYITKPLHLNLTVMSKFIMYIFLPSIFKCTHRQSHICSIIYQLSDIGMDDQITEGEIQSIIYQTRCFMPNILHDDCVIHFLAFQLERFDCSNNLSALRSVTIYIEVSHIIRLTLVRQLRTINHHAHISGNTYRYAPSQWWLSVTTNIHKYRLQTEKSS